MNLPAGRRPRKIPAYALFPLALAAFAVLLTPAFARAESRLYHLQVTLRSGDRYETISASDPFSYCSCNGGVIVYSRDASLVYSPQMKVKIIRTWIEYTDNLAAKWPEILKTKRMLQNNNHKTLPRLQRLSADELRRPD